MKQQLQTAMKEALKARDKVKLDTIRIILSSIQYEEMEKKLEPLPNDQILSVLQREIKKRREEIEYAEQAHRADLKEKLLAEIAVVESFLPAQMSASELEKIVTDLKSKTPGINMGAVMKVLKESYSGLYDGKVASEVVKRVLG